MSRKINITFEMYENDMVKIIIFDESKNNITTFIKEYDLVEYSFDSAMLYNQMLDDFNAEYDEDFANSLDIICEKIMKESGKSE